MPSSASAPVNQGAGVTEQVFAKMALSMLEQLYIDFANAGGGDYRVFCEMLTKVASMPAVASRVESAIMFGPSQSRQQQPAAPVPVQQPRPSQGFTESTGIPPELDGIMTSLRESADRGPLVGLSTRR